MKKYIVITTINEKTKALSEFEKIDDWHLIIVGDKKSKPIENSQNLTFLSVEDQKKLGFSVVEHLPYNHYTRKNIGYLYAIREGAEVIYDTDDDNLPYPYWKLENFQCGNIIESEYDFVNIYRHFSNEKIWPRGFPLDLINAKDKIEVTSSKPLKVGIWQGLADLDPDVDAIYRLVFNQPVTFERKDSVILPEGKYCPFNSQNTFWAKEAFPFLYLPATTSFRFTDILRGYIAQRLLWAGGMHLGFHEATVFQERNVHDFMKDFRDEIECYLNTRPAIESFARLKLTNEPLGNFRIAYQQLHLDGLISADEISIVEAWLTDLESLKG